MIYSTRPTKASIYFQCALWGFAMIAFALVGSTAYAGNGGSLVTAVIGNVVVNFFLANIHIYIVFPHFFLRKKYLYYFLGAFILLLLGVLIKVFFIFLFTPENNLSGHDPRDTAPIIATLTSIFAFIFSFLFRVIDNLVEKKNQEAALKEAQLLSELGFLRSQINPHALFNILNTIYSMIYTGSKEAGNTVLKLSELMRYMLYETNEEEIPLTKEVKYIRTYIDLYTIKQKGNSTVEFSANGIPEGLKIPPLLLVPFIENAFKHGNWDSIEPKGWIKGKVTIRGNVVHFSLVNSIDSVPKTPIESSGGIGIQNVQKRLDILLPNKHTLNVVRTDSEYQVELTLEIDTL